MMPTTFPIALVIFYAFSALLITSALMVILSKHPVQSALYLVVAFFASSGLWIMAQAEFLGLILILVYVGAVMTLFLFVVMTIPTSSMPETKRHWGYAGVAFVVIALFVALLLHLLKSDIGQQAVIPVQSMGNTAQIGHVLYTNYVFAFEIAGVLLLTAIIAAISLSYKVDRNKRTTKSSEQIAVTKKSRLRVVNMASEKIEKTKTEN